MCSSSAEADSIKHYVRSLGALAIINVALKAVWVVDVVLLAKKGLKETHELEEEEGESNDDGRNSPPGKEDGYVDDPAAGEAEPMSDRTFLIYFSIQVCAGRGGQTSSYTRSHTSSIYITTHTLAHIQTLSHIQIRHAHTPRHTHPLMHHDVLQLHCQTVKYFNISISATSCAHITMFSVCHRSVLIVVCCFVF